LEDINGIKHLPHWLNQPIVSKWPSAADNFYVTFIKIGLEWKLQRIEFHHS